MKTLTFVSVSCLLLCVVGSASPVSEKSATMRRREMQAVYRGFLCYLKGVSLDNCMQDRQVNNIMAELKLEAEPESEDTRPSQFSADSGSKFPLPPAGARKRDAFYSDWKRK